MNGWRKSSYSGTSECVEAASFRKASHSMNHGDCVEAGDGPGVVAVRDSKTHGTGPVLAFTPDAWTAFCAALKDAPGRS